MYIYTCIYLNLFEAEYRKSRNYQSIINKRCVNTIVGKEKRAIYTYR